MPDPIQVLVVGGGAAGLTAAIHAARALPRGSVVLLDGAAKLGAKILVSGGGRCNVTNRVVTPGDFCGGSKNSIRRVLAAFTAERTVEWFQELGVEFYEEEENGKLFPVTNQARTVLDALINEAERVGVDIRTSHRVTAVRIGEEPFQIETTAGPLLGRRLILSTGGQSLPKTGSDGFGFELARTLGHSIVPPVPALVPLVLEGDFHVTLSGISQRVELVARVEGSKPVVVNGILLWTHFGISGPAALDVSRHWHRARQLGLEVTLTANLLPGKSAQNVEDMLIGMAREQPRLQLHNALGRILPSRVAEKTLVAAGIDGSLQLAHLPREIRREVAGVLVNWQIPVQDSRGFKFAEATAGGVPLTEVDSATMASRKCPGLFLAGEILDVDGRIGGFNFQWAWSSGKVAGTAASRT